MNDVYILPRLFHQLLKLLYARQAGKFYKATGNVAGIQQKILAKIIKRNRFSLFGERHGFSQIRNYQQYSKKVPLSTYDDYTNYIDRISQGEERILTSEDILLLEPSSGSAAPSKYIPYTKNLRREFHRGIAPWLYDLFRYHGKIMNGKAYWSITPIGREEAASKSKLPIGFDEDAAYFGLLEKYIFRQLLVVPKEVALIENIDAFKYTTLFFLLKERDLAFISIWNPTFLLLLFDPILEWKHSLIKDIRQGDINPPGELPARLKSRLTRNLHGDKKRADELQKLLLPAIDIFAGAKQRPLGRSQKRCSVFNPEHTPGFHRQAQDGEGIRLSSAEVRSRTISPGSRRVDYHRIWPLLSLISVWGDSYAGEYLARLKELFPKVDIQPKGLIATEGIVSIPVGKGADKTLAVTSHYFEFAELNPDGHSLNFESLRLAHQLEAGKRYSVVLTTSGGLYRYRLQDIIEVHGYLNQCPLVKFIGKEDKISDLVGEKLHEIHVAAVLNKLFTKFNIAPQFHLLAPEKNEAGQYFYVLFLNLKEVSEKIRHNLSLLLCELDQGFQGNYHYKYCRDLGQLQAPEAFLIDPGLKSEQIYLCEANRRGQKLGNIKVSILDKNIGWSRKYKGTFFRRIDFQKQILMIK